MQGEHRRNVALFRRLLWVVAGLVGMGLAGGSASASDVDADAIRPWPQNPGYWQYKGEPVLLLGGSWQDNLFNHPQWLEPHLDMLASVGGNVVRNTMSTREDGNEFPFERGEDGRFDLEQFNGRYWQRLDDFLRMTYERDIIVQIEVFDMHDLFQGHGDIAGWGRHPFNPANNVNYTAEESGLPTEIEGQAATWPTGEPAIEHGFFYAVPELDGNELLLGYQRQFVDKLLEVALAYPHVLFAVQNESSQPVEFGDYWADYLRERAAEMGREIYVTDMRWFPGIRQDDHLYVYDQPERYTFLDISQNNHQHGQEHWDDLMFIRDRTAEHRRPINNTKVYNSDTPPESVARMFRNVFGGAASSRFHRPASLTDPSEQFEITRWGIGLSPLAQATIRSTRMVDEAMDVFAAEPRNDLLTDREANEAYCMAEPGRQYAVFFPDGGEVRLDLSEAEGAFHARWLEVASGIWQKIETKQGGERVTLAAPGEGAWVVVLAVE